MNDKKDPLLLDHDYDGIQELDHPLPRWWIVTFVICIIFAIFYFIKYQIMKAPNLRQEYQEEVKLNEELKAKLAPPPGTFDLEKFNSILAGPEELKKGAEVFSTNCVACHKEKAEGDIGPNLTDNYWINGEGKPEQIHEIISDGREEKGMPVWKEILTPDDIMYVAAFVKSLKGSNPPGAKAPQGKKVDE